jgi:hypothetical protein
MAAPAIDHVVILVPQSFLDAPPSWLSEAFTLYPGGKHVDGATQNTLVLLPDGSYLEFIAFVPGADPVLRQKHRWGDKHEGTVIDWALTLGSTDQGEDGTGLISDVTGEAAFRDIQRKVSATHTGISYRNLAKGGRRRLDGVELRWAVSSPQWDEGGKRFDPGQAPFWCLDDTPRHLRVPFEDPGVAVHASGVTGIASIEVLQVEDNSLAAVYEAVLGEPKHGGWILNPPSSNTLHPSGKVILTKGPRTGIVITFYTDNNNWAGKTIGGKVGEYELHFELVGSTSQAEKN